MEAFELTTDMTSLADQLAIANAELSRAQISVAHRAARLIRDAIRHRHTESVRTVSNSTVLTPNQVGQMETAIGEELSLEWRLDVTVDSYTPDQLHLTLHGPLDGSHTETVVSFLATIGWWPSKVSVVVAARFAVDPERITCRDELRELVRSVTVPATFGSAARAS